MSSADRLLVAAFLFACMACGRLDADHTPRPRALIPSRGSNALPLTVTIEGENFHPVARQRLGESPPVERNTDFQAFLGDIPLEGVRWRDAQHLEATIPAGLPVGRYALRVVGPLGQEGRLADAFIAGTPGRLEGTLRVSRGRASVGQELQAVLTLTNTGETALEAVEASLERAGAGVLRVLEAPPPLPLAAGEVQRLTWRLQAAASGPVTLTFSARGLDVLDGEPAPLAPLPAEVVVEVPASLSISVSGPPRVSTGQDFTLTLQATNTGETTVVGVSPGFPEQSGTGAVRLLTIPAPQDIPSGETRLFVWDARAEAAGSVSLAATASGTDSHSGATVSSDSASAQLTVQQPAALSAALEANPARVNEEQNLWLTLTVQNTGEATALAVTPVPPTTSGSTPSRLEGPTPARADIPGGGSQTFTWRYAAGSAGTTTFSSAAEGTEANTGAALSTGGVTSAPIQVLRPALLTATASAPARVNVGQEFELAVDVANSGESSASGVAPSDPVLQGTGSVSRLSGPAPVSATLPGGASQRFTFRYSGGTPGDVTFGVGLSGTDETDGRTVSAPTASTSLLVQRPAALASALSAPATVGSGRTFTVTHQVTNTGEATVTGVTSSALSVSGTGAVTLVEGPTPSAATLQGGESVTFTWTYAATADGVVRLAGSVSGTDVNDGALVSSPITSTGDVRIADVVLLASDPFGDGSAFSFVFGYRGRVYLGPNRTGTGGVHMALDGTGAQSFAFRLQADRDATNSRVSENVTPGPLPSIGFTGCTPNTSACGPDNEDGRGLFFAGAAADGEWLGIAGARSGHNWDYLYLTQDTDSSLDFNYVDVSATTIGDKSSGVSSAHFFKGRLYVGIPDYGGSRPTLLVLKTFPTTAPGLQVSSAVQAESLEAARMPYVGKGGSPSNPAPEPQMIDALVDFKSLLYLANNGGCMRATVVHPRPYTVAPGDWASCTPPSGLTSWWGLTAITPSRAADLEPADKAVPQMAAFSGRLYLARNTTAGPQLFVCDPGVLAPAEACDPGEWSLVAPNSTGDTRLTQFDDPENTHITLLVATSRHLYVGFNNATRGVVVFRTDNPAASTRSHFSGQGGCGAELGNGTCQGLGGNGLGAGVIRIFSGLALSGGGMEAVYLTAGTGSGPVRVFQLPD